MSIINELELIEDIKETLINSYSVNEKEALTLTNCNLESIVTAMYNTLSEEIIRLSNG